MGSCKSQVASKKSRIGKDGTPFVRAQFVSLVSLFCLNDFFVSFSSLSLSPRVFPFRLLFFLFLVIFFYVKVYESALLTSLFLRFTYNVVRSSLFFNTSPPFLLSLIVKERDRERDRRGCMGVFSFCLLVCLFALFA